ncbi:hypothetical protein ATANTOWER_006163 [Ataeniobius toweri]|uniref:Uncharacterized protein n=1 Tax=Ataeniobius toweri TaxID=208326 RepID=A0ABU7CEG9_9TELE|nr:hypothetical protein [Ataeniobius toweri]
MTSDHTFITNAKFRRQTGKRGREKGDIWKRLPGLGLEPRTATSRTRASAYGRTLSPLHHQRHALNMSS